MSVNKYHVLQIIPSFCKCFWNSVCLLLCCCADYLKTSIKSCLKLLKDMLLLGLIAEWGSNSVTYHRMDYPVGRE